MPFNDGYKGQAAINAAVGEVIFPTPARSQNPYDPQDYQFEKVVGKRMHNGVKPLKRLNARHKNIIALHLRCLSNRDIAFVTGLSEQAVWQTLKDPISQEIIHGYLEGLDQELLSLAPLAVDAIRSGLGDGDIKNRLTAADRFFKATGKYAKADSGRETAEDVLARALARVASENASTLREITRPPPVRVIEGRVEARSDDETD